MRRTLHAATITLALLTPGALAQATYLALDPHPTLEAAEAQAATLTSHDTTVITEATSVPGYESINLQQHAHRVLVGPLDEHELDATRAELAALGHETHVTTTPTELRTAYQVQVGAYRSDRLAADARTALQTLGEPTFQQDAPPFTFVHAGPYHTRQTAEEALARIQDAGITNRAALGTLTREHQATLEQANPTETPAAPDHLTALPIPVPPAEQPAAEPMAELQPEPAPASVTLELEPHAVTTAAIPLDAPAATALTARPKTVPTPATATITPAPAPDYDAVLARATARLGEIAAHVTTRAEEVLAEAARRKPTYVHVAAGVNASQFIAPLAALDVLGYAAQAREANGTYRLYVGPIPAATAATLRLELRRHGIASFTTDHPTGLAADLPEASEETHAEADAPTQHDLTATPAPLEEAVAAEAPPTTPEPASDTTPNAGPTDGEERAADEPAWRPEAPLLTSRTQLAPGTYLTARIATDPAALRDAYEQLTQAGRELALLQAGDSTILLVGPLGEWEEDQVTAELHRSGMPALTVHHPQHARQSDQIAQAAQHATTPSNYLALEPLEGLTLDDLTARVPDLITVTGRALLGPIPNDLLAETAKPLTRHASVTFHAYPAAPPAGAAASEWAEHAYALLEHQQVEAARQAFLEARALDATHYDALFGLAVTEDQLGDRDAAEFAYQYVMSAHPERFEARFNYALRTHRHEGAQAAIPHYQHALTLAAEHPAATRAQAHAALAAALATSGDHNGAAEHYQSAYDLTDDPDHLVARLKAQRSAGQALDLLPELTRLELDTRDARFTALIADIYAQAGQAAYAIDAIDRRMRDDLTPAQEVLLLNARAATHATAGNDTQALADLEAAHQLDANDATTRHNLGLTLLAQGQAAAALPHLQAAVQLGVTDPLARLDVAEAAHRAGAHQTAAATATAAAENLTGPERQRALRLHAEATQALGQHAASLPSLEELLAATPNDARLLTMAGTAYYLTGQFSRAADRLEAAHNLGGGASVDAALVNAYLASQRYADAERLLRAALAVTPDDADALHKLGWALLHLGNHQAAKSAWADATALNHTQAQEDLESVFPQ